MDGEFRLRFFFDAGSGTCLWAANEAARARFGYPVLNSALPISRALAAKLEALTARYDESINWRYPPDPTVWLPSECAQFNADVDMALAELRLALGPAFDVADEFTRVVPGP